MKRGDILKQRYQFNAEERLFLGFAPNGCLLVHGSEEGYRWVLAFSHDVHQQATKESKQKANELMRPKDLNCQQHLNWIYGTQCVGNTK